MTNEIFAADPEGFREQNAGRPAAHLVRELIQNALDEACTRLTVDVAYEVGQGVTVRVEDDVEGGIRDESLIWTIWLSDKVDSPTKRGRMGRGLKELISVSDETLIVSQGCPAVLFTRFRGKWARESPRKVRPERGTRVDAKVKLWKSQERDDILAFLRRIRPPDGVTFLVNGEPVVRAAAKETYDLKLPTVVFEVEEYGRVARERKAIAKVELFAEAEPWVYEMGLPIEKIEYPLSIDVGQRVPLREKRDTLTEPYRRELMAKLLDVRLAADLVKPKDLKDTHALLAASAPQHLSTLSKQKLAEAWTGGMAYAASPEIMRSATGQHVQAVSLRSLPEAVRGIVREVGRSAKDILDGFGSAECENIARSKMTPAQLRFVRTWEYIIRGIGRSATVGLYTGRPSALGSYGGGEIQVYVENAGDDFIAKPLGARQLALLIHELSHWKSHEDSHGFQFHGDMEDIGGAIAAFLCRKGEKARAIATGAAEPTPEPEGEET